MIFKHLPSIAADSTWEELVRWILAYDEVVQKIVKLHRRIKGPYDNYVCRYCSSLTPFESEIVEYPCPTIKIIHGEQKCYHTKYEGKPPCGCNK